MNHSAMKYKLCVLLVVLTMTDTVMAQNYIIRSKSATEEVITKVSLDSSGYSAVVEQGNKTKVTYPLDTLTINGQVHTVLRDAENKDKIISALNCSEAELNTTFRPIYSGVITLLDSLSSSSNKSIEVTVSPMQASTTKGTSMAMFLVIGVIGMVLGAILAKLLSRNKKPKPSQLKIDSEVADMKHIELMDKIRRSMDITKSDVDTAGSFTAAVSQKYTSMKDSLNTLSKNYKAQEEKDSKYFENIEKIQN